LAAFLSQAQKGDSRTVKTKPEGKNDGKSAAKKSDNAAAEKKSETAAVKVEADVKAEATPKPAASDETAANKSNSRYLVTI